MTSRIATTRVRNVNVSSNNDAKNGMRLPLSRISTNRYGHAPLQKKPVQHVTNPQPKQEYTRPEPFIHRDVEIGDPEDPQDVVEFEHIIYRSLRSQENSMKPLEFRQREITIEDRNLLVDAICRFHYKLALMTNTFYRFIGILDRYISVEQIQKSKLKLIGCACFLIASKIEDIYPVQSSDLIVLSDRAFTQKELFAAEIQIINAIGFDTTFATPLFYLTQFMRINGQTKETLLLARYILEICQSHEKFFGVKPALMASVSVLVLRKLKGEADVWPKDLQDYTQFALKDLEPYSALIRDMLLEQDREETKFMRRKYGSDLFLNVAHISIPQSFK